MRLEKSIKSSVRSSREKDIGAGETETHHKQLEASRVTGSRKQGRDRNNVQWQWGWERSRERIRCAEGRKMMDSSQPLGIVIEEGQSSEQVNAKGRPGWSGTKQSQLEGS